MITSRYTRTAIALHWLVAVLILFQIGFGWYLGEIPRHVPARGIMVNLHKSVGITVGLIILLRLAWRATHPAPAFPSSMLPWQVRLARWAHRALYACMLVMPLSGYVATNFSKFGIKYFGLFVLPPWGVVSKPTYELLQSVHVWTSYLFVALIGGHVLAALKHLIVDRDDVFRRMWLGG
jgi:cytochrome b561